MAADDPAPSIELISLTDLKGRYPPEAYRACLRHCYRREVFVVKGETHVRLSDVEDFEANGES